MLYWIILWSMTPEVAQGRNSRDKEPHQYSLQNVFTKSQGEHMDMAKGSRLCPFGLWPEERTCWTKVHKSHEVRERGRKPRLKQLSNLVLSRKPFIQSHHYKAPPWEGCLFQLLSSSVTLLEHLPPMTWKPKPGWVAHWLLEGEGCKGTNKCWGEKQIGRWCRKPHFTHFTLWLLPVLWRHNDQSTFTQCYFHNFPLPFPFLPSQLWAFLLYFFRTWETSHFSFL